MTAPIWTAGAASCWQRHSCIPVPLLSREGAAPFSPGNRRHDRYFRPISSGSGQILQKPDIFSIHVDIDESPERAGLVADAGADSRILRLEFIEDLLNCSRFHFDQ